MNGHSKIRNRAIANVFNKMGFVESWGTGVKRILSAAKSYGLPTPSFNVLELLSQDAQLSARKMAEAIGISSRNVEANVKKLKSCGILIRHGSPKKGYWEIVDTAGHSCKVEVLRERDGAL